MSLVHTIDGTDVSSFGLRIADAPGTRAGLIRDHALAYMPGRDGALYMGADAQGQARERRIVLASDLNVAHSSTAHATLLTQLDELKWRIARRDVQIVFGDQDTRYYTGRIERPDANHLAPVHTQRIVLLPLTFLCGDPLAYAVTQTTVTFTSAAAQCPLWTGLVYPLINVVGPVGPDFDIIYRDSGGTEQGRTQITGSVPSGQTLAIDCANQIITLDGADANDMLVDSTSSDFITLDPKHGTTVAGAFPTLEITKTPNSAQAIYRRAAE
jgi:phage-related protein